MLGQTWWNKERRAAYASTGYRCLACWVFKAQAKGPKHLEGHELYSIDYSKGRMVYVETVPLCHYCHNYIHLGRLEWLVETGKEPLRKLEEVTWHGDQVLGSVGLEKPSPYLGKIADWPKWKLVVGKKSYKGLYKSLDHWLTSMRRTYGNFGSKEMDS